MEQLDVAHQNPQKAKELEEILENYLKDVQAPKWKDGITWKNIPLEKINSRY